MHPVTQTSHLTVPLREIENEMCTISCEMVSNLVSFQKSRPLLLAVIENNGKRVGYYDALKLSSYFRTSKKIEDPNTRLTSIKLHYLWNRISSDEFSEFQMIDLESNESSQKNGKRDEILKLVFEFATALQGLDLITRVEMQIKIALRTLENQQADANGDISFIIELIYNDIKDAFFALKHIDMQSFKKNLYSLYRRTLDPRLGACLCVDEWLSSSFVHKTLDRILQKSPDNTLALTLKGRIYTYGLPVVAPNLEEAKKCLEMALCCEPVNEAAWIHLAECDIEYAIGLLKKYIEMDPKAAVLVTFLGRLMWYGKGDLFPPDLDGAKDHFVRALTIDRNCALAHTYLGLWLQDLGRDVQDFKDSFIHLTTALELDSTSSWAHTALGRIYEIGSSGVEVDRMRAYEYYKNAIKLLPKNPLAHAYLGCLLFEDSDTVPVKKQEAYSHLKTAVDCGVSLSNAYAYLGEILRNGDEGIEKDPKLAEQQLLKAIELDDNSSAHASLGLLYQRGDIGVDQNLKKAFQHFEDASGATPQNNSAIIGYLNLLYDEEWSSIFEEDRLENFYKELLNKAHNEPNSSLFHAYLGETYRIGVGQSVPKDRLKAHDYYIKALTINPDESFAHCRLGALLMEDGVGVQKDLLRAYEHFDKAIKLRPDNPYARKKLEMLKKLNESS